MRHALPAGLLLVVLAMLGFSYIDSIVNGRSAVRARAREDAVLDAEHLARIAQRDLLAKPGNVESDLSVASTERRSTALAVISPAGRILMAQRLDWRGQAAAGLIPEFSQATFLRVVQGRMPEVQELSAPPRVTIMVPFFTDGGSGALRDEDRGVIYLAYELSHEYALVQWDAQQRMWPLLAAALLTALGLSHLIRSRVTRPLALVEHASLQLAEHSEFPAALPETGLREIARLAQGFNVMVARLQHAQHDSESSRARLMGIFDAAMDAIITVDQTQQILVINPAALTMFGYTEPQLLGQPVDLLIPQRFGAAHRQHIAHYALSGRSGRSQSRGRHAVVTGRRQNGEEFPAEASISHIEVNGALLLTVILRDVTGRQHDQEAILALNNSLETQVAQRTAKLQETTLMLEQQQRVLQAAHEEQNAIFNTVTVGIALVKDRTILRCNRRLETLFGYAPGALDGQGTRLWYAEDAACHDASLQLLSQLAQNQTHLREQELVRKDGSRFWAHMTGSRFVSANLEQTGSGAARSGNVELVVIEDLSLRRAAEQAILHAKEQAVEASQAKSHFLANMSHEIRTPMNAIIGLSYLMQKSELSARQHEQVRKIQLSSQHLLSIVNDVLDYSKIEAGKLQVEHIAFELDQVLDSVASLVSDRAALKNLKLLIEVGPEVPQRLLGDPLRLGQILVNYANNAIKFTPRGEVRILVALREDNPHDVLLHCTVSDTGIGLNEEQMQLLFQSFQQADSSTTRQFGGTGLGLAICKQLANLMQGEVGVQSVAGEGSSFWFTARLQKNHAPVADVAAHGPSPATGPRLDTTLQSLRGAHILLVEDNELNREVACELLNDAGVRVDMAEDGQQALERIRQHDYDLVLMDMQMPVMNGLTATRLLRAMPRHADLPVIAMTANAMAADRQHCLEAGMNDHVSKPIEPDLLFATLLKWLRPRAPDPVAALLAAPDTPPAAVPGLPMPTLPLIAGLDTQAGLRRVRGKVAFYMSLLRKFADGQNGAVAALREELQAGQPAQAQRRAHTLKSLAASIGIDSVAQQAAQVEALLKSAAPPDTLAPELDLLESLLYSFLLALTQQLPDTPAATVPAQPANAQQLASVCQQLAALLAEDNLEAVECLAEHAALLQTALGERYGAIADAVQRFDCAVALQRLQSGAEWMGISIFSHAGNQ